LYIASGEFLRMRIGTLPVRALNRTQEGGKITIANDSFLRIK
jgi:hypothetical protein